MEAELLSKTDNTVRTVEIMFSLTGAPTRTLRAVDYLPGTLYITYTKLGEWPWKVEAVELAGRRRMRNGVLGKLQVREPLTVREGTISVSTDNDQYVASPALAALVTEHMPKDE